MKKRTRKRQMYLRPGTMALLAILLIAPSTDLPRRAIAEVTHYSVQEPTWRATAIHLPTNISQMCVDATHPHMLLIAEPGTGTVAYDWESGQAGQGRVVNQHQFAVCGPQVWLFAPDAGRTGA